ncbi:hypothetical protein LOD99_15429 [Oopsacas minuta]|uniref:BZIP domain-containing protein n=1 Tax=Oopsacas minuta TaxID=111878 RepID=A0AAV7KE37_9METZ|nr:hypothetical protein LOD99_15429 [Oopsacas minuta]
MNQYLGPPPTEDNYFPYSSEFNFDLTSYPNLMNEHLPPAPSDIFTGYPQVYPPAPAHPHMSVSSAQGQMYPPSISEYPSNGSNPWTSSPPHASLLPPSYFPPVSAPPVPQGLQDDDQRVQQELLELLGDYNMPADNFYAHPQGPMYDMNNSNLASTAPSPYNMSGHDFADSSPQSSLAKPSFDEELQDINELDDLGLDLEDLELPPGVTEGDLATLKIPDLNKKLRDLGLSRDDQNLVKKIRRQHKNRRYAHTCRQKKVDKKNTMKVQKQVLESEINDLKLDVEKLRRERDEYKKNYEIMQKRKLELRV